MVPINIIGYTSSIIYLFEQYWRSPVQAEILFKHITGVGGIVGGAVSSNPPSISLFFEFSGNVI